MPDTLLFDLFQAYYDARKHKRRTLSQLRFEINLESNIIELYNDLKNRRYKVSRSMCFIISDPVKREIFAASFRDRVVHHLLYNYISPVLDNSFICDSYSCRKGKGTMYGVKRLQHHIRSCSDNYTKECYVLKLDISGYFMNINRQILFDIVLKKLSNKEYKEKELVYLLLKEIIFSDPTEKCFVKGKKDDWTDLPHNKSLFHSSEGCGLPIGNLTSQLFSNVYLSLLDEYVKNKLKIKHYGRYVDDFYIIHNSNNYLASLIPSIKDFLTTTLFLNLHPNKIYLQNVNNGINYLGAYLKPYRQYLSKRTVRNLYSALSELYNIKDDDSKSKKIRSVLNSYLGYASHFKEYRLINSLINRNQWLYQYGYFTNNYRKFKIPME
jgi:RNA-directed DNA polymerase